MNRDFSWINHEHLGWPSLMVLGVVIGLAIVGFFVVFFYLPTRPRKLGWMARLRKRSHKVTFTRRREEWMDQIGQAGLRARDRRHLAKHLSSVYPELRRKAAKILREKGGAEGVRETQKQLSERGDPDLVVDAIVNAQWREMEPALLPLIREKDRIAKAAISALAELGGQPSLSALLALEARPNLAEGRDRAIIRLQKRLGGQDGGQVSLSHPAENSGALGLPKE